MPILQFPEIEEDKALILLFIIKKYNCLADNQLGRTIMQKLVYFLKFAGLPLNYSFKLYHYGPFSSELLTDMDILQIRGLIEDHRVENASRYTLAQRGEQLLIEKDSKINGFKDKTGEIVDLVGKLNASDMELFSTTHYIFWAYKNYSGKSPQKDFVIDKVYEIKEKKFQKRQIISAFDQMKQVGMLD